MIYFKICAPPHLCSDLQPCLRRNHHVAVPPVGKARQPRLSQAHDVLRILMTGNVHGQTSTVRTSIGRVISCRYLSQSSGYMSLTGWEFVNMCTVSTLRLAGKIRRTYEFETCTLGLRRTVRSKCCRREREKHSRSHLLLQPFQQSLLQTAMRHARGHTCQHSATIKYHDRSTFLTIT